MGKEQLLVLERSSNFENPEKIELIKSAFAGFPLDQKTNLEQLSSLIPDGVNETQLRDKISERYSAIHSLRKRAGQPEEPVITNELAIAIVDDGVFEEILKAAEGKIEIVKTARHEAGHTIAAVRFGWSVPVVTVEPGSYYLGLTIAVSHPDLSFDDWLLESAAISLAGATAAKMSGDEVKGIGADLASACAKAKIAVLSPFAKFSSEAAFLTAAENLAHSALKGANIDKMALILAEKKTLV